MRSQLSHILLPPQPPQPLCGVRGSHLGHVGEHPLSYSAQSCASLLGALRGAGGGRRWAENWAETRVDQWQVWLPSPRADCPPPTRITQSVLGEQFHSQVSCCWLLAFLPVGIGEISSDQRT